MKVGSLIYATDQGLGILAKSFFDAGIVTDVMVVRHGKHVTHDNWYPGSQFIGNLHSHREQVWIKAWAKTMDVMLFFETPFLWELIDHCRENGVKTAIMPMHECMPVNLPATPDLFICPSLLDLEWAKRAVLRDEHHRSLSPVFIPVPVEYPWRKRTKAEVFVHNAGHGGLKGRNGTQELFQAMEFVESPIKLIVRGQGTWDGHAIRSSKGPIRNLDNRVELRNGSVSYSDLFTEGDVFVFPEKFNGLSLPLQEARAAGMLVMCGDRFPMNEWLPREPLISVKEYRKNRIGPPYSEFDEAVFDPRGIAAKIDEWYGRDISEYSESGREWAETMSWEALKPRYVETLENLVR